ncbi:MAG: hypothetical protein QM783_14910 [Phycisphaerales bacterium]
MIKKLIYLVVGLVVLVVIGVVIVFMSIDSIAKSAIEKGGTYALGTQTSVSSVSVGVFKGEFSLSGLKIANPGGADKFSSPHFFSLNKGATAVSLSTIRQPTVEISSFTLDGLDAYLERKAGTTNYGAILDNLKKVTGGGGGGGDSKPAPSSGDEKKFIIHELKLTNITVHVDLTSGLPNIPGSVGDTVASATKVTVPIDRIELKEIGQPGGVTMSQLSAIVVKAVLQAAAEKGGGLIPGDLLGDLQGKLSSLTNIDSLTKGGMSIVANAKGSVEEIGKKIEGDVKKGVDDAAKGVGDALKGVLPGGKKK